MEHLLCTCPFYKTFPRSSNTHLSDLLGQNEAKGSPDCRGHQEVSGMVFGRSKIGFD